MRTMALKPSLQLVFVVLFVILGVGFRHVTGKVLSFVPSAAVRHEEFVNQIHDHGSENEAKVLTEWSGFRSRARNTLENLVSKFTQSNFLGCPCTWPPYCEPISSKPKKEVMAFSVSNNATHWANYDWKRITTIIMFDYYNADLMCLAHQHGVRAVIKVNFPLKNITNETTTKLFIKKTVEMVQNLHIDGVNFDIEDAVDKSDFHVINALTTFVKETVTALKTINQNYQISFDAAWSPDCVDNRCYDLFAISQAVDYLFIMAYDEQSQMLEKNCIARPNSGFNKTITGVLNYIQKNIPRNKLILGVPWYGYDYPCLSLSKDDVCAIKKVPFRGADCSDAAGSQISFMNITALLSSKHLIQHWDNGSSTPFFNYKGSDNKFHQVRYDNVKSLSLKYAFAVKVGLGGVGMWNVDYLNYSAPEESLFKSMWNALPEFTSSNK